MSLRKELLDILVCPECKGPLEYREKEFRLLCHKCRLAYEIENGVPNMLVDEAKPL